VALEGKPSPTGRLTFTSHRLWKKDAPLVPSGLLGPVVLRAVQTVELKRDASDDTGQRRCQVV